ncbi:MAG TPA: Crp/Fnr family transcriptional regulator [Stellaceae bacterium]|nr:Crp/Fnr family transcriptional regulator [Stellaceae bacterium]
MLSPQRSGNRLLAALSADDFAQLAGDLQPIVLGKYQVVYEVGARLDYIHFVDSGLASVVTIMEDGASSAVGMIGPEGLIGASALLGGEVSAQHVVMQVAGDARRISVPACRAVFDNNPRVRAVLLRFIEQLLNLSAQIAGCQRLHSVEQRTARWLLMASDRIGLSTLPLTQEFIAAMLGVRRSGVSEAASELQRRGLIRYRRGDITIIDRAGLVKSACECYALDRQRVERLP